MATISKDDAVARLRQAVSEATADDLAEMHKEFFPAEPVSEAYARQEKSRLMNRILAEIDQGLAGEDIVDLWNVAFPVKHRAWFDDEQDLVHYDELREAVSYED